MGHTEASESTSPTTTPNVFLKPTQPFRSFGQQLYTAAKQNFFLIFSLHSLQLKNVSMINNLLLYLGVRARQRQTMAPRQTSRIVGIMDNYGELWAIMRIMENYGGIMEELWRNYGGIMGYYDKLWWNYGLVLILDGLLFAPDGLLLILAGLLLITVALFVMFGSLLLIFDALLLTIAQLLLIPASLFLILGGLLLILGGLLLIPDGFFLPLARLLSYLAALILMRIKSHISVEARGHTTTINNG